MKTVKKIKSVAFLLLAICLISACARYPITTKVHHNGILVSSDSTWKENGAIHNLKVEYDLDGKEKSRVVTVTTTKWGLK